MLVETCSMIVNAHGCDITQSVEKKFIWPVRFNKRSDRLASLMKHL